MLLSVVVSFAFSSFIFASPIDQLQNNNLHLSSFLSDKDRNLYLIHENALYVKSNQFGDVWGKIVADIFTAAIDPTDSKIIWIVKNGKLQKTTDSGKNWSVVADLPSKSGYSYIFVNPHNNHEIFIGTTNGLYKINSNDTVFKQLGLKDFIYQFMVNPKDRTLYYALTDKGLYSSKDTGVTWQRIDSSLPSRIVKGKGRTAKKQPIKVIGACYVNHKSAFLMVVTLDEIDNNKTRLFITKDEGKSWVESKFIFNESFGRVFQTIYVDNSEILLATSGKNIYRSKDGINWDAAYVNTHIVPSGITKMKEDDELLIYGQGMLIHTNFRTKLSNIYKTYFDQSLSGINLINPDNASYSLPKKQCTGLSVFSHDSNYLVMDNKCDKKNIKIFSSVNWKEIAVLPYQSNLNFLNFSNDDKYLMVGEKNKVRFFNTSNWTELPEMNISLDEDYDIPSAALSPDGRYLVARRTLSWGNYNGREPNEVCFFERSPWHEILKIKFKEGSFITYSPDGYFLSISENRSAHVFQVGTFRKMAQPTIWGVENVSFSLDGKYAVLVEDGRSRNDIYIFETSEWKQVFSTNELQAYNAFFSPDGHYLVVSEKYGLEYFSQYRTTIYEVGTWLKLADIKNFRIRALSKFYLIGENPNKEEMAIIDLAQLGTYFLYKDFVNLGFDTQARDLLSQIKNNQSFFSVGKADLNADREKQIKKLGSFEKDEFETTEKYQQRKKQMITQSQDIDHIIQMKFSSLLLQQMQKNRILLETYEKQLSSLLAMSQKNIEGVSLTLGEYAPDFEVFPVIIGEGGPGFITATVKIPRDSAKQIKDNPQKLQLIGKTQLNRDGRILLVDPVVKETETGLIYPLINYRVTSKVF